MSPAFNLPEYLMDENAVHHLNRDLHQVFVAAMHGIAGLEGGDIRPTSLEKHGPRLGGADIEFGISGGIFAFAQHRDAAGQINIALLQNLRHARMFRIGRAIDVLGLEFLVDRIFIANLHNSEYFAGIRVDERDFLFSMDAVGEVFADGERDGDRPEETARQLHVQTRTAPVIVPHKAVKRRVGAHGQHEDVGDGARIQRNFFQFSARLRSSARSASGSSSGFTDPSRAAERVEHGS